jgi:UDP-N-acetylglucosamine diphosphorylase / glucose-1-phosphate thymidylyltransferase / UDP-N-acetylgalactosamine diphosphorylase / glucosamine-1-phosphate N-acetyltransferase / galactosamine-1-phosphate N-acetyltransferase
VRTSKFVIASLLYFIIVRKMMKISDFVENAPQQLAGLAPWTATQNAPEIIRSFFASAGSDFTIIDNIAIHKTSVIESGAIIKGSVFIGPGCLVAAGAYLRGGVWLQADDIVGPHCELKTTFMFGNSKTAHLNFVGDSILGQNVNVEAGAIIANYRNEKPEKAIWFQYRGKRIETGVEKFGAVIGDNVRIGANAVIAPGAAIEQSTIVRRLELIDQA